MNESDAPTVVVPAPGKKTWTRPRPEERQAILRARFLDGLTIDQLCVKFDRADGTIKRILHSDEARQMEVEIEQRAHQDTVREARRLMRRAIVPAVEAWTRAIPTAADMGKHLPAKDLLLHTKVISPLNDPGPAGPRILICVGMPGAPAMEPPSQEELEAVLLEQAPQPKTVDGGAEDDDDAAP